ncbi:MAG: hypothetical protein A2Z05_03570 [Chloroflexi bacterium RBG_16_60_22]|nr:MAG: hypothetical protein A2Z05_03570 [Chloroflexi bacterium RBG_16_60_22]
MGLRRFLFIVTAATVIALIITAWFFPSNDDFRVENPFWNGAGDLGTRYPVRPLNSLADLPPSGEGATLITIPYAGYTEAELERIGDFVTGGGRLILADDYGHGNEVLEALGLGARFSGEVLLDPLVNYRNEQFPRIIHLASDPLTANADNLVFNHATSLDGVGGGGVLARSSAFSFLDRDGSGTREENEPAGPLPVIARQAAGRGQVVLIADPSLFINAMESLGGNAVLMQNIAAGSTALYLDQSHLPASELHRTKDALKRTRDLLASLPGTAGLVLAALVIILVPVWHGKKIKSPERSRK